MSDHLSVFVVSSHVHLPSFFTSLLAVVHVRFLPGDEQSYLCALFAFLPLPVCVCVGLSDTQINTPFHCCFLSLGIIIIIIIVVVIIYLVI